MAAKRGLGKGIDAMISGDDTKAKKVVKKTAVKAKTKSKTKADVKTKKK